MDSYPEFSRRLSMTLDSLGYSSDMVKHRVQMYREIPEGQINAGSKGEGLTAPYESDTDTMIVGENFVCGDDTLQLSRILPTYRVYRTDRESTPPGYTYLTDPLGYHPLEFGSFLCPEDGVIYVSSDLHATGLRQSCQSVHNHVKTQYASSTIITMEDRSGPSLPITGPNISVDLVLSYICFCPDLLQSWVTRPRYNDWPTLETIQQISHLEGHVVPVGFKGSEHQYKEWRICFTKAELCLIHSMNDTQTKLYILLKMVAKNIIQSVCKDITSYAMKNIALWMAELNPRELFRQELLIDRLIQSLKLLRLCVTNNFLPNYMIPSRNLLAGRLDLQYRKLLSTLLTDLITDRRVLSILLQQWPKLKNGLYMMYTVPESLLRYGEWRDMFEKLHLLWDSFFKIKIVNGHDEQQILVRSNIDTTMIVLLIPDMIELFQSGMDHMDVLNIYITRRDTVLK